MKRALFPLLTLVVIASLTSVSHAAITYSGGVADADNPTGSDPNTWDASTTGYIGYTSAGGNGTIGVTPTSTLLSKHGYIGEDATTTGEITVDGTGAVWSNTEYLIVGENGTGALNILDGGAVTSGKNVYVGKETGSTGTMLIDDASVIASGSAYLDVGFNGTGHMTIQNGGTASCEKGRVGYKAGSAGSTALVTGPDSTWTSRDDFMVGVDATSSGILTIEAGGQVIINDYLAVGYYSGAAGTVTVTGSGSKLEIANTSYIGKDGPGTLNISSGGLVTVGTTLFIDRDVIDDPGDPADSFINMSTGGMLAVLLQEGESADLDTMIDGDVDHLRWWNDSISGWDSINNATPGTDYTLVEQSGYALLTVGAVPEPTTLMLLVSLLSTLAIVRIRRTWNPCRC